MLVVSCHDGSIMFAVFSNFNYKEFLNVNLGNVTRQSRFQPQQLPDLLTPLKNGTVCRCPLDACDTSGLQLGRHPIIKKEHDII
jgi:hypothetical protein